MVASLRFFYRSPTAQHQLHDVAGKNNGQVHGVLDKVGDVALTNTHLSPPAISGLPKELMWESTLSYVWAPLALAHQPFGPSLSKVSSKAEQRKNRTEGDSDPDICLHPEGFSPILPYFNDFLESLTRDRGLE